MKEETAYQEPVSAEEEKNVRLTVVGLGDEKDDDPFDLGLVWQQIKRLFALWLCAAVGVGALTGAAGMAFQKFLMTEEVKALINCSVDSGVTYDIRKVKSPGVVEAALSKMNRDLSDLESIRDAIHISGVIPDGAYDRMSMYYNIVSGNTNTESAVRSLLDTSYSVSRYIISFDYAEVKFSMQEGLDFMNALLQAYQDYFAKNYNYNTSMGNPLSVVDYKEYDYAEAVNIFSTTLENVSSYLSAVESSETASFRSVETGFTFQDLRRAAATLQDIDLDRLSSYIVIHSVSSFDVETEIAYYRWLIENLTHQRAVQKTRLDSLTQSIEAYEKDPILIAVQDGNSVVANMKDLNSNYDDMIREKLDAQANIASYSRSISYYESVIEGFQSAEASTPEDIEKVERYLASLSEKVNALIQNAAKTVNEYYERAAFANRLRVLVPATCQSPSLVSVMVVIVVALAEVLTLGVFGMIAVIKGLQLQRHDKRNK